MVRWGSIKLCSAIAHQDSASFRIWGEMTVGPGRQLGEFALDPRSGGLTGWLLGICKASTESGGTNGVGEWEIGWRVSASIFQVPLLLT